ncbi:MAG: sulfotransferase family 2 domain-containing protein [Myxococcota bacterium]|nr:sulfotransferase family 2 domain-containing protein [Myxococcota bacterium]
MISHRLRCIFVHVPKTGGSSIELFLTGHDWIARNPDDYAIYLRECDSYSESYGGTLCAENPEYFSERVGVKHATQSEIRFKLGRELWDGYFSFTFVRNPWDRVLSVYDHGMRDAPGRMPDDFRDWIRQDDPLDHMGRPVFRDWVDDWEGFDFVGRFETLAADFQQVLRALDWKDTTAPLPEVRHGSDGRHRLECYDAASRDVVAARCAEEIARFDYRFGDSAPQPGG